MSCCGPWPIARQTDPSAFVLTARAAAELTPWPIDSQQSLGGPSDSSGTGETAPPRPVRLRARLSPDALARGHIARRKTCRTRHAAARERAGRQAKLVVITGA